MQRTRIMIIESKSICLKARIRYLNKNGYRAWSAKSQEKTIRILERTEPDVILIGGGMSSGEPLQKFITKIRNKRKELKIIVDTYIWEYEYSRGAFSGVDSIICRPAPSGTLISEIERLTKEDRR